jgi:uncharacterized protein YjbI with pentapeptide repeats
MRNSPSVDLKERWKTDKQNSASHFWSKYSITNSFKESPFGFYNHFMDFRGFSSKDSLSNFDDLYEIKDIQIKKSDFSRSRFSTVNFYSCKFKECLFEEVIFENDSRFWSQCEFVECTFLNATFINCAFNNVNFLRCSFEGTKWKTKNVFSDCTFRDCSFSSNIKNIDFSDTNFVDSKFRGVLENVTFLGWSNVPDKYFVDGKWTTVPIDWLPNRMRGVDFSEAELISCTFSQYCNLDKIKSPLTNRNCAFFVTETFYDALASIIEKQWKNTNVDYYENGVFFLSTFYKPDNRLPAAIAHKNDFSKKFGENFSAEFYSALCLAAREANATINP